MPIYLGLEILFAHPLLKKPFTLESLAAMVQAALQGVAADKSDNVVPLRRDLL